MLKKEKKMESPLSLLSRAATMVQDNANGKNICFNFTIACKYSYIIIITINNNNKKIILFKFNLNYREKENYFSYKIII